jgi:tRNA(Arg) A34 adenosine deaminase TadA
VTDTDFMREALALAAKAELEGEVPVGALVVCEGEVVGRGWNRPIVACDPTAHAEIVALRQAAEHLGNYRLSKCTLYVTIEPCTMCAGAIVHSRIERLVFGAPEPKAGVVLSNGQLLDAENLNHKVLYEGGVLADECSAVMSAFFKKRRAMKKEEKKKLQ